MANLVDELVVGDATSQAAFGTRNTCASLLASSTLYTKRSAQNSIICFCVRKTELYHFIKFIDGNCIWTAINCCEWMDNTWCRWKRMNSYWLLFVDLTELILLSRNWCLANVMHFQVSTIGDHIFLYVFSKNFINCYKSPCVAVFMPQAHKTVQGDVLAGRQAPIRLAPVHNNCTK